MTQYDDKIEKQKLLLAAEDMKDEVTQIHAHKLTSMYYETELSILYFEIGGVTDVNYMDGRIERTRADGTKYVLVEGKTGNELIQEITRRLQDSGKTLG